MQKLPIGVQDFTRMREDGYIYVDKTRYFYDLIQNGSVYFLSRPRRFGKSLLISALEAIFQGKKELFTDLWIGQSDYDWQAYPVIRIDMSETVRASAELLDRSLIDLVQVSARRYRVDIGTPLNAGQALANLLRSLGERGEKAVVLIDEYDKPMLDNINDVALMRQMRDILREFYTILKAQDGNIKFVLLTGVTKFSKVSVFSGLNNLQDLTLDREYSALLGYTQEELGVVFRPWIEKLAKNFNHTLDEELAKIKLWYNGYRFSSQDTHVYNPFSTLLLFQQQEYRVFWFETGTPTLLIDLLERSNYLPEQLGSLEIGEQSFSNYDIDKLELVSLLYQTGYLTISHCDPELRSYTLRFPNLEVEQSFNEVVLARWVEMEQGQQDQGIFRMIKALKANNYVLFFDCLKSFIGSIPYNLHEPTEAYYHSIFYLIFHLIGYRINAEVHTNVGRIDAVIEFSDRVLIFEFKLNQSAEIALQQIHDKKYAQPYQQSGKVIELFGVSFSTTERNITEWLQEQG